MSKPLKLEPVKQSANPVRLRCVKCGEWKPADELLADLNGEPFVDYYCHDCVEVIESDYPIDHWNR